jgi:hypothetical protein
MENINIENINIIKKNFKHFLKNPKQNYNNLILLYQQLVVYYFYLKSIDDDF